jgi:predicted DNA-binding protein with PD1-like motif
MKTTLESGAFGRTISIRLAPNEDITEAIEAVCRQHHVTHAMVRAAVGSLAGAVLEVAAGQPPIAADGIALEMLSLVGEIRPTNDGVVQAQLSGLVGDTDGRVWGGRFVPGANRVCVTMEIVLQEWLPHAITT